MVLKQIPNECLQIKLNEAENEIKRAPRIAVVLRCDVILHCSDADLLSAPQLYAENGFCGLT